MNPVTINRYLASCGSLSYDISDDIGQIVFFKYPAASLHDSRKTSLIFSARYCLSNDMCCAPRIVDVDQNEAVFRKIGGRIRTSKVKRKAVAQKTVRNLFRPVMRANMIFYCDSVPIVIETFSLLFDPAGVPAIAVKLWHECQQFILEYESFSMQGTTHSFGGQKNASLFGFSWR